MRILRVAAILVAAGVLIGSIPTAAVVAQSATLGAEGSASTVQRTLPLPVTPHVQPAGSEPAFSWSKFSVSANAAVAENTVTATAMMDPFID